jgi:pimeloyl-ACP methyl ester carboxylesterase
MLRLAITALVAGLCTTPGPNTLEWSAAACPFDVRDSGVECAALRVPLDYHNPRAGTIDMMVSRVRARTPARRGVLVVNHGGPAAHLADTLSVGRFAPELADAYDMISFDQRGFGASVGVACQVPADRQQLIPWPRPGGFTEDVAVAKEIADTCARQAGPVLAHMGTAYVARDMDVLRQALGVERINYLGLSYGSYLGTAYASMFPRHTDRVLLADVVAPSQMWRGLWQRSLGDGFEIRFPDYAVSVGEPADQVRDQFVKVAADLDHAPLTTPLGVLGGNEFRMATYNAMKDDAMFPALAQLVRAVRDGDATKAGDLAANNFGAWSADPTGRRPASLLGVSCDDAAWPRSLGRYEREVRADAARYPLSAGTGSNVWPCAFWPYPVDEQVRANPLGPRNILIMNNTRDPSTPLANAHDLRAELGDRARLVTVDEGGHDSYMYSENPCARRYGTDFLKGGPLPADDVRCPGNRPQR